MYLAICAHPTLKSGRMWSQAASRPWHHLGFLLIVNREECDHHVGGGSKAALAHGGESHVRDLLDSVVDLALNDGSGPRYHGIKGYLNPNLTTVHAMGLKGSAVVDGDRPIIAEADEFAQQHLWEPQAVSAHGTKTSILTVGAVGQSSMFIFENNHENITNPMQSPRKTKL
jgi:hypothetical protein